jgi:hypothetical protein
MDEGVEFAVLAAGVDPRRQFGEKLIVVRPPGERGVERARVEADEDRLEAGGNELPRELAGVAAPEREQAALAARGEPRFAVRPDVLEEEVAEPRRRTAAPRRTLLPSERRMRRWSSPAG